MLTSSPLAAVIVIAIIAIIVYYLPVPQPVKNIILIVLGVAILLALLPLIGVARS